MIGNIYRIFHFGSDICYIGSTFKSLKHRLSCHRSSFKRWDLGLNTSKGAIYPYFLKYGPYEFAIELIKQYEVVDKHHLFAYETLWMSKYKKTCVNEVPSFAPLWKQRQKASVKRYWRANRELINEKCKQYNEAHKERLTDEVACECGGKYQLRGKSYHLKSKKHTTWASQ
jgi:hypothetical protein